MGTEHTDGRAIARKRKTLPRAMSIDEVARDLSISTSYVRKMVKSGALPHIRFGARVLISRAALAAFIEECSGQTWKSCGRGHKPQAMQGDGATVKRDAAVKTRKARKPA